MKTRELIKKFQDRDPPEENSLVILESIKAKIDGFREKMWLIELVTIEAMKNLKKSKGHWEEIHKRINEKDENEEEEEEEIKSPLKASKNKEELIKKTEEN